MPFLPDLAFIKTLPDTGPLKSIWDDPEMMTEQEAFEMGLSGFTEHMRRISEGFVPPQSMSGHTTPPDLAPMSEQLESPVQEREAFFAKPLEDVAASPD